MYASFDEDDPLISRKVLALWLMSAAFWFVAVILAAQGSVIGSFVFLLVLFATAVVGKAFDVATFEATLIGIVTVWIGLTLLLAIVGKRARDRVFFGAAGLSFITFVGCAITMLTLGSNFEESWPL